MDQREPVFHWKICLRAWKYGSRPQFSEAIPKHQRKYCKGVPKKVWKATSGSKEKKSSTARSKTGRPLLLEKFDSMVQIYIEGMSNQGAAITWSIANTAAKALIRKYPNVVGDIKLDSSYWALSLFRMGFSCRRKSSTKVDLPESAPKKIEYLFLYEIVSKVEKNAIPDSLIINFDQTPLKMVQCGNNTLAQKNTRAVTIVGADDKISITATFSITLLGQFLPIQLIYWGKTSQNLPRYQFPRIFSLSVNEKHFSNTSESIKLLNEIIVTYVKKERESKGRGEQQKPLVIMDVFTGQMTSAVKVLEQNHILVTNVSANMTRF